MACTCAQPLQLTLFKLGLKLHGVVVYMDFLHTAKVFPTNLLSAILSANIILYAKCCFHSCQKKSMKILPTFSDKLLNFFSIINQFRIHSNYNFTPANYYVYINIPVLWYCDSNLAIIFINFIVKIN